MSGFTSRTLCTFLCYESLLTHFPPASPGATAMRLQLDSPASAAAAASPLPCHAAPLAPDALAAFVRSAAGEAPTAAWSCDQLDLAAAAGGSGHWRSSKAQQLDAYGAAAAGAVHFVPQLTAAPATSEMTSPGGNWCGCCCSGFTFQNSDYANSAFQQHPKFGRYGRCQKAMQCISVGRFSSTFWALNYRRRCRVWHDGHFWRPGRPGQSGGIRNCCSCQRRRHTPAAAGALRQRRHFQRQPAGKIAFKQSCVQ